MNASYIPCEVIYAVAFFIFPEISVSFLKYEGTVAPAEIHSASHAPAVMPVCHEDELFLEVFPWLSHT